ncbi:hypothetical protein FB45DRAFT_914368 [Roridomyces roridus]|uniref:DUF7598 domain-containing protein n=1 Tax=Roridomyces roridus TaxID=1738132 RepID=A0AAD7BXM8_9AGAR|nr:hypothetical protein FB45DRAFT_914368 [Roridomyces roridus]
MSRLIFYSLNATRALSIIALLLVFSSSVLVMVTNIKAVNRFQANRISNATDVMLECDYIEGSTVPNQPAGVFWSVVATLLIIFQVIILLFSEIGWPAVFFDRFFPVLGANFGVGPLGIFMCLIGAQILSHHVDDFTLVAAFFVFSVGCLNMLMGLIFREGAKTKRALRAPKNTGPIIGANISQPKPFGNEPYYLGPKDVAGAQQLDDASFNTWKSTGSTEKAGYGFGRQGEKAAGLRGFLLQRPEESLPRYASPTPTYAAAPAPLDAREHSPSRHAGRSTRSTRSGSSRSGSSRSSSRSSESSRSSTSSFASPMSYRQTIEIPDEDQARPETPPPFPGQHAPAASRYGRNPSAF